MKKYMKLLVERIDKSVPLMKKHHEDDAAYDLYAAENYTFEPFEVKRVRTGLKIVIPQGHVGLIRDRSSVATQTPLLVKAGVIDTGYRGEWQIVMVNLSQKTFKIEKNTRIAQFLILPIAHAEIEEVEKVEADTSRGEGGFGSTGKL